MNHLLTNTVGSLRSLAAASLLACAVLAKGAEKPGGEVFTDVAGQPHRLPGRGDCRALVLFFVAGDLIHWSILLPGLAWRAWIFAWVLPSALALWHMNAGTPPKALNTVITVTR